MSKETNTPEFRKLQAKWYKKLEKDGFEDIECTKPGFQNSDFLKNNTPSISRIYKPDVEEHYARARIHLHHHNWRQYKDNGLMRFIWKRYCEGDPYRGILEQIASRKRFDYAKYSVYFIFYRMKKLMIAMHTEKHWEDK